MGTKMGVRVNWFFECVRDITVWSILGLGLFHILFYFGVLK